jgi:hypothetical protein
MVSNIKIFIDLDKTKLKIFINYFMEDSKTLIKIPLEKDNEREDYTFIVDKFDISDRIYLTHIN